VVRDLVYQTLLELRPFRPMGEAVVSSYRSYAAPLHKTQLPVAQTIEQHSQKDNRAHYQRVQIRICVDDHQAVLYCLNQ
jgi:hypothetical protein